MATKAEIAATTNLNSDITNFGKLQQGIFYLKKEIKST